MSSIDDIIINMLKGNNNPKKDIVEKIQLILLMDTNNQVPSDYIKEVARNV